jgi:hypothetical protein
MFERHTHQLPKHLGGELFGLIQQPQREVLRPDVVMADSTSSSRLSEIS